jgi:hypothetical protein
MNISELASQLSTPNSAAFAQHSPRLSSYRAFLPILEKLRKVDDCPVAVDGRLVLSCGPLPANCVIHQGFVQGNLAWDFRTKGITTGGIRLCPEITLPADDK